MQRFAALTLAALVASPLAAQPVGPQHQHAAASPPAQGLTGAASARPSRPYPDLAKRRVKALSEEQAAELLAGRGISLALAAELNGYPGPMHVLEHAAALGLTPEQRARAENLRRSMEGEARAIGARIVASEEELDALFARGEADAGRLAALSAALGALGGRLREVHLAAHIGMRDALSPEQRAAYARLRGYTPG